MNEQNGMGDSLYTPQLIEFAGLGVELARLLEQGAELRPYVETCLKVLPRLYSLSLGLPTYFYDPSEDYVEEYITETSYERVRERAATILGEYDAYLTTLSADMQYSETPLASFISEQLADIYQHVGNLLGVLKEENTLALPAAIGRCRLYWQEHWGLALISALGALHSVYLSLPTEDALEDEDQESEDYG